MSANFVAGSVDADRALYTEWGATHTAEQRLLAAEAGLLIWWGAVFDVIDRPSYTVNAADRALAFAGDNACEIVAARWRLVEWRDVDHGSVEMLRAARERIKRAFKTAASPHGASFWTNTMAAAVYCTRRSGLDAAPETIVPSDVARQITPFGGTQ